MRRALRFALKGAGFALAVAFIAVLGLQLWFFAHVLWLSSNDPQATAFMQARLDRMLATNPQARLRHQWAPYARISGNLKRAVVAAEDAKFVDHEGFDWQGIQKALERNEKRGRVVAGGSTISQQLAKNLFLSGERSWVRKGQEAAITWMLETALSKRRILELYLNVAEWGEGVFGAEAAAQHHFGLSSASLNAWQAAWLAAILPSPRRYAAGQSTPYADKRAAIILARMGGAQIP